MPPLRRTDLDPNPVRQIERWRDDERDGNHGSADAAILATSTRDGRVSARTVLLVRVDEQGIVWLTNHHGRKSRDIADNPRTALVLLWERTGRQVRVEGEAQPLDPAEADDWWRRHPPARRLAEAVWQQTAPIEDRAALEAKWRALKDAHPDGEFPRPDRWGGHRLMPDRVELWQEDPQGLNDRFEYARESGAWRIRRLEP